MKYEYNEDGSLRSISAEIITDRVRSKLIAQGTHPEVADFVEENFLALNSLHYSDNKINPNFLFAGERITKSAAEKIAYLRQFLKPNESLAYIFEGCDRFIGPQFKKE
jgi:hypothetical protein